MPFYGAWYFEDDDVAPPTRNTTTPPQELAWRDQPLADRVVELFDPAVRKDHGEGRRLRVFATLIRRWVDGIGLAVPPRAPFLKVPDRSSATTTYAEVWHAIENDEDLLPIRDGLSNLQLRFKDENKALLHEIPTDYRYRPSDPELHYALQDLAYEIGEDIHEACHAFSNPDLYYPGVDEGIEPVPDDHVHLVMWAMQRELNRELRPFTLGGVGGLPAAPLAELPFRIQRALAERRRLRYLQYGIDREAWEKGVWSLFNVQEDPDFIPRRSLRLGAKA